MTGNRTAKTRRPGGPKSRNACDGCRRKKIKCDERKPGCSQCEKSNLSCPGYIAKLSWSTKHEVFLDSPSLFRVAIPQNLVNSEQSGIRPDDASSSTEDEALKPPTYEEERVPRFFSSQPVVTVKDTQKEKAVDIRCSAVDRELVSLDHSHAKLPCLAAPEQSSIGRDSARVSRAVVLKRGHLRDHLDAYQRNFLPGQLVYHPTFLVEGYFRHVCAIFSSFDSIHNPFRTMVEDLWQSWAPLYYAIQSMAAAYLANFSPAFEKAGIRLQHEAYRELSKSINGSNGSECDDTKIFLTVLLLGLTTAWHSSSDIGTVHLQAARRLLKDLEVNRPRQYSSQNLSFFRQCMLYWEMLIVFVWEDPDKNATQGLLEDSDRSGNQNQISIHPHPWTTVAPDVNVLFAQVGALVRRSRRRAIFGKLNLDFMSFGNERESVSERSRAEDLEERLLSLQLPSQDSIIDPGDSNTPASHFMAISEAYRYTALLMIYHVWPEIAEKRLPAKQVSTGDVLARGLDIPSSPSATVVEASTRTSPSVQIWLTSLSLHILHILKSLPSTSGTRFLQPIVLLSAANELRSPVASGGSVMELDSQDVEVSRDRLFVVMRLTELSLALPAKPVVRVRSLVQEVWERMDTQEDVFWLDVMLEMGWETIVG